MTTEIAEVVFFYRSRVMELKKSRAGGDYFVFGYVYFHIDVYSVALINLKGFVII